LITEEAEINREDGKCRVGKTKDSIGRSKTVPKELIGFKENQAAIT
jgi:hypothetical protein